MGRDKTAFPYMESSRSKLWLKKYRSIFEIIGQINTFHSSQENRSTVPELFQYVEFLPMLLFIGLVICIVKNQWKEKKNSQ